MLLAKGEGFGHPFLKLFDAGRVAGVGGHEFGWLFALTYFSHALPESWRFRGIETGPGDKQQTHVIGFRLVVAGKGEEYAILCADS